MRSVRPPRIEPAIGGRMLNWAREAQQTFRDISAALNEIAIPRPKPPSSTAAQEVSTHPFKLVTRVKPGVPTVTQGGVVFGSCLYQSLRPNHKYTITGLLNADQTSGWFDLIGNDAVWLGIVFNSARNPTSASIDSWGQGDLYTLTSLAWSGTNSYCEDDGSTTNPRHQTSRVLIATSLAGADGKPIVTQRLFHDQTLRDVSIDTRSARYPFSHQGGYPL